MLLFLQCQSFARPTETVVLSKAIEGRVKIYSTNNNQKDANAPLSQSEYVSSNREDPMTAPQWPIMNQPMPVSHSNDISGHIFNHKGGLHIPNPVPPQQMQQQQLQMQPPAFQLPPYNLQPQQPQLPAMENGRPLWQQMPQFPMKPLEQIQPGVQQNGPYNWPILSPNLPVYGPITNNNEETLPKQDMVQTFEDTAVADKKKNGKNTMTMSKTGDTSSTSAEEKDSEYDNEEEQKPTEPPPPKKKLHKHKKVLKTPPADEVVVAVGGNTEKKSNNKEADDSAPQQLKMVHKKLQMEFLDHDGDSEKPSGAVLSLTLGISSFSSCMR